MDTVVLPSVSVGDGITAPPPRPPVPKPRTKFAASGVSPIPATTSTSSTTTDNNGNPVGVQTNSSPSGTHGGIVPPSVTNTTDSASEHQLDVLFNGIHVRSGDEQGLHGIQNQVNYLLERREEMKGDSPGVAKKPSPPPIPPPPTIALATPPKPPRSTDIPPPQRPPPPMGWAVVQPMNGDSQSDAMQNGNHRIAPPPPQYPAPKLPARPAEPFQAADSASQIGFLSVAATDTAPPSATPPQRGASLSPPDVPAPTFNRGPAKSGPLVAELKNELFKKKGGVPIGTSSSSSSEQEKSSESSTTDVLASLVPPPQTSSQTSSKSPPIPERPSRAAERRTSSASSEASEAARESDVCNGCIVPPPRPPPVAAAAVHHYETIPENGFVVAQEELRKPSVDDHTYETIGYGQTDYGGQTTTSLPGQPTTNSLRGKSPHRSSCVINPLYVSLDAVEAELRLSAATATSEYSSASSSTALSPSIPHPECAGSVGSTGLHADCAGSAGSSTSASTMSPASLRKAASRSPAPPIPQRTHMQIRSYDRYVNVPASRTTDSGANFEAATFPRANCHPRNGTDSRDVLSLGLDSMVPPTPEPFASTPSDDCCASRGSSSNSVAAASRLPIGARASTRVMSNDDRYSPAPGSFDPSHLRNSSGSHTAEATTTLDPRYTPSPKRVDAASRSHTNSSISILDEVVFDDKPAASTSARQLYENLPEEPVVELASDDEMTMAGSTVSFFGHVTIHVGKKDRKRAHARIRNMKLSFHEDEETDELLSGPFLLVGCHVISRIENTIYIRLNETHQKTITFTVDEADGRPETWSLLLGECWLSEYALLKSTVKELNTCGTFYLRQGAAGVWQRAAGAIHDRTMYYVILGAASETPKHHSRYSVDDYIYEMDIRKILNFHERVDKDDWCAELKKKDQAGPFMLTLEGLSLYLECEDDWTTQRWAAIIQHTLNLPANNLDEFRLTGDNVPIMLDKCIRFIGAFGMQSEGVYRRNGKISEAKQMFQALSQDPVGTHLTCTSDESVYAAADVLRQFLRKLQQPLIPLALHDDIFAAVLSGRQNDELWADYRHILARMPLVNYHSLRKLIAHLTEVVANSDVNKASVDNVAKMFGPTMFHTDNDGGAACFQANNEQIGAVRDFILGYDAVFEITTQEEISRDMIKQAQKLKTPQANSKRAGGLLVPIHLWEKENRPFNVLTELAAEEVCKETIAKRTFDAPTDGQYALFEIIRGGQLSRRLPVNEKLSSVVVQRWIPWHCSDGYLLFNTDTPVHEEKSFFSGKLKYAEHGSRTFKSHEFKVEDGTKVSAYKGEKLVQTWLISDTVWFKGAENTRKAPYTYNLTFFNAPSTDFATTKYAGHCLSFKTSSERARFLLGIEFVLEGSQPQLLIHV